MIQRTILIFLSISISIICFLVNWYSDQLIDAIWIFGLFIDFLLLVGFISVFVFSIINYKINNNKRVDLIPIFILIINFLIVFFLPFREVKVSLEINLYNDKRNEVIEMIKNNELTSDECGNVQLPNKYKTISTSGEVHIYKNNEEDIVVGFWVFRGMTASGSISIIYTNDSEQNIKENVLNISKINKLKAHWYYVITE